MMSATTSATTGRRYGLERVCRTWERSRSALYARRALQSPSGLPPPPPNSDRASSSRHSSCENFLAIKCPRKP